MWLNEIDPFPAAWQRVLMAERHLPDGHVDERSIADIVPTDLAGLRECHFFAGIGVWPLALRLAGWPFDRVTWTGSCPCQPFSSAGKGKGFADERHLWPLWFHLIEHCEPECILGEQVEGAGGRAWLDIVFADLEGIGYTCGAVVAPAAGFGAPHQRSRLYWMAHDARSQGRGVGGDGAGQRAAGPGGVAVGLADPGSARAGRNAGAGAGSEGGPLLRSVGDASGAHGAMGRVADADRERWSLEPKRNGGPTTGGDVQPGADADRRGRILHRPSPTNGLWGNPDWLLCRDQKWRPVRPGTFPLADAGTVRNRVGTLRGAGNALALAQAVAFIEAVREVLA